VLDSLNPGEAVVARTEDYMGATRAAMTELEEGLLPEAALTLGLTTDELDAQLSEDYPEFSAALDAMPGVVERYEARTAIRVAGADDLRTLKDMPIGLLGWFGPAYGLLVGAVAAAAWYVRPSVAAAEQVAEPRPG
jgi:hypothetical protein